MNITSTSTTSSPVTFHTTAARMSGGAKSSAAASTSSSSSTKTYDKKDTNQDGTVSAYEELVYDMKHPAARDTESTGTQVDIRA